MMASLLVSVTLQATTVPAPQPTPYTEIACRDGPDLGPTSLVVPPPHTVLFPGPQSLVISGDRLAASHSIIDLYLNGASKPIERKIRAIGTVGEADLLRIGTTDPIDLRAGHYHVVAHVNEYGTSDCPTTYTDLGTFEVAPPSSQ